MYSITTEIQYWKTNTKKPSLKVIGRPLWQHFKPTTKWTLKAVTLKNLFPIQTCFVAIICLPSGFHFHFSNKKEKLFTLWPWPMTSTYKHDLDSITVNQQAKYLGQRSFCCKVIISTHRSYTHVNCSALKWLALSKFHNSSPSCPPRPARWTHNPWLWQAQKHVTAPVSFRHKTPTEHCWPIAASHQHAETATGRSNSKPLAACHQCTQISAHDWHFWISVASDRMDLHIQQDISRNI